MGRTKRQRVLEQGNAPVLPEEKVEVEPKAPEAEETTEGATTEEGTEEVDVPTLD